MAVNRREELLDELVNLCRQIGQEVPEKKAEESHPKRTSVMADDDRVSWMDGEGLRDSPNPGHLLKKLIPALLKIALMTCIFFSIYEVTKQLLFSRIILWQSHIITIIFASLVAALGAYFPLRRIEILYERSMNELAARKQAQAIQRESEERYRQLFEMESDALFLIDDETDQILEVNDAAVKLYGFEREELLGIRSVDLVGKVSDIDSLRDEQEIQGSVCLHRRKGDGVFPVEITTSLVTWYGRRARLSAVRDVTEQLNAQNKIERQRAFLKKVIDAVPNLIYVKDRENRILLVNRTLAGMFAMTSEQMVGKTFTELLSQSELSKAIHRDDLSILRGEKDRIEREESFLDASGTTQWRYTIKVPMKDAEGRVEQLIGVSTDITERKLAEEALKKREMELEVKSRNLEEVNTTLKVLLRQREEDKREIEEMFLSNVKDLVIPYVEKMKGSSLDVEQKACLETLEAHLNDIISPFVTKITSKYINLTPKEIQVASLIKDGKTTKEIAVLLNIAPGSVDLHRNHIRSKLGINNQNVNLRSYLLSLP